MIFYDATKQNSAVCQLIDRLCDTTDTTFLRLDKTAEVNNALEQVIGWIIGADGTWKFDDSNYTNLPIGTITLVEGQSSYSFTDKFLAILSVDVLDQGGMWRKLDPFDPVELGGLTVEEYFGITASLTPKGMPTHYDKVAQDTVKIYPAPTSASVTLASGLRVRFKRTASLFAYTGTIASPSTATDSTPPGFASPYHSVLAYMASINYCATYKKDRVALYQQKIIEMKDAIIKLYARKELDKRKQMSMTGIAFR